MMSGGHRSSRSKVAGIGRRYAELRQAQPEHETGSVLSPHSHSFARSYLTAVLLRGWQLQDCERTNCGTTNYRIGPHRAASDLN